MRLINELLQTELNAKHMPKHIRTNSANNISGENYDERESGTDKISFIQVATGRTKPQEKKIFLI